MFAFKLCFKSSAVNNYCSKKVCYRNNATVLYFHGSMISQNVCNMGLAQSHVKQNHSITALQYRCIVLQQTYVSQAGLPATFDNV